ncbi:MAG TPA: GNAT family N-acetyltransferase [Candidatus Cybelea sp.]
MQVEAWDAAYRGLIPDEVIDARTVERRTSQWSSAIVDPRSVTFVACDSEGNVQGFASAQVLDELESGFQSYLQTLYVRPQFWRKGIGHQLLRAVCSHLSALGVRNLVLRTMRLGDARKFYDRLGARLVPEGIARESGKFDDVVYAFDDVASDRHP